MRSWYRTVALAQPDRHGVASPVVGALVVAEGVDGSEVTAEVSGLDGGAVDAGVLDGAGAVDGDALRGWLAGGAVDASVLDWTGAADGCAVDAWLAEGAGNQPVADATTRGHEPGAVVWAAS
jgi:hypothetical protein